MANHSPADLAAILLAAGSGSRFGADKLMHALPDGTPIAIRSARHLRDALPDARHVAVVRPGPSPLRALLEAEGFDVVVCEQAAQGMGHSLGDAARLAGDCAGLIVALGDMPFLQRSTIISVAQALADGASIAAPVSGGKRGHPVAFAGRHRAALMLLAGDEGARRLIKDHHAAKTLVEVAVDDAGIFEDVDTPADLAAFLVDGRREGQPEGSRSNADRPPR